MVEPNGEVIGMAAKPPAKTPAKAASKRAPARPIRMSTRLTPKRIATFLDTLAQGLTVSHAARRAGYEFTRIFYRERERNEDFAAKWAEAVETGSDAYEDEVRRRGVDGVEKPVYWQGQVVGSIREYSDSLLMFMLKKRRPEFREAHRVEMTGKDGGPLEIHQLEAAREQLVGRLASVTQLRAAAGGTGPDAG